MKLSVCLIVCNEAEVLEDCLESIANVANEIIVVDTGSKDSTISLARSYTDKVYQYEWEYSFAKARNYAINKASHPWILFLDADERLNEKDQETLKELIKQSDKEAYFLKIINHTKAGHSFEDLRLSLFRNHRGYYFRNPIHEEIISSIREQGQGDLVAHADIEIFHHGYIRTEEIMLSKAKRNKEILTRHLRVSPIPILPYFWAAELLQDHRYKPALNALLYSWHHSSKDSYYLSDVLTKIIYTHIQLKMFLQAKQWLDKGQKLYPELHELETLRALVLFLEGKYGEAQGYLYQKKHEAIELHVHCKYALAREVLLLSLNKFPKAHMLTEKLDIITKIFSER